MRQNYLGYLLPWGISVGLLFSVTPSAFAVLPASVNQDADVAWSNVVDNPFDGKLVYDKHFTDNFAFVTISHIPLVME
jgi:hypothetical protein